MVISQKPESALLYVKDKGRVRGPFLRDFIDAMILSGHFSTTIEISLNGQSDWTRIDSAPVVRGPKLNPGSNAAPSSSSNKNKNIVLGIVGAAGLGLVILIAAANSTTETTSNKNTSASVANYSTPPPIVASTPKPVSTPIIPVQSSTLSPINQSETTSATFEGWNESYKIAVQKAEQSHKNILIYFSGSDWSSWSQKQKNELLNTSSFQDYAANNLVLLQVDFPYGKYPSSDIISLKKVYQIYGFPSFVLIKPDGNIIKKYFGYLPGGYSGFKDWLDSDAVELSSPEISKYSEGAFPIFPSPTPSTSSTANIAPFTPVFQSTPRPTYTQPSSYNSSLSQSSFNDTRGTTYTYRQSQAYTLNKLDQVVREKKGVVASCKQSMDAINAQIKAERPYIDHSSQNSVDQFNYKIDRYNDLRLRYNSAIDDMNAAVDQFNAELHRIGTPARN
ncbi:MAG: thioredoxin family protein [Verrucomicrobia bacterium]|nr:thioredoxin family protein [Verrucomicrobiota bacterium]